MIVKAVLSKKSYLGIRLIIGGIFLYAGILKLTDISGFSQVISAYGLIPGPLTGFAALTIALAETVAGGALIADRRGALTGIAIMLILFMAVLLYGIQMGFDVDCGCFGDNDPVGNAFHSLKAALLRDVFMAGAVVYLFLWRKINHHHPVSILTTNFNKTERKLLS